LGSPVFEVSLEVRLGAFDGFEQFHKQVDIVWPVKQELSAIKQLLILDSCCVQSYDVLHVVGSVAVCKQEFETFLQITRFDICTQEDKDDFIVFCYIADSQCLLD